MNQYIEYKRFMIETEYGSFECILSKLKMSTTFKLTLIQESIKYKGKEFLFNKKEVVLWDNSLNTMPVTAIRIKVMRSRFNRSFIVNRLNGFDIDHEVNYIINYFKNNIVMEVAPDHGQYLAKCIIYKKKAGEIR